MDDEPAPYHPPSDFLMTVLNEEAPLSGSAMGEANLARLIAMTTDADRANRDWAVFLLMQTGFDTPEIRAAFVHALDDEDQDVRSEALVAMAQRDRAFAKPLVLALLEREWVFQLTLEAASFVADPVLLPGLRAVEANLDAEADEGFRDDLATAIEHCRTGEPAEWRVDDD